MMRPISSGEKRLKLEMRLHRSFYKDAHRERTKFKRLAKVARRRALARRLQQQGE